MRFSFVAALGRMLAHAVSANTILTKMGDELSKPLPPTFGRYDGATFREPKDQRLGWGGRRRKTTWFMPHGDREKARRRRQDAHHNQMKSHKPGTVQPRHIFGGEPKDL